MTPEVKQALYEQDKIKETLATDGAKILYQKLLNVADGYIAKEQTYDPFTAPGDIVKARQIRFIIKTLLPEIIEGFVNYDPEAIDKQVASKEAWGFWAWVKSKVNG